MLISLHIDTIWTTSENLKNIELNALTVYDDRYIKTKIGTYGDKVYTNIRGLNVPENGVECESFTIILIDCLLVNESKCYLKVYIGNCTYKIVNAQIKDYLGGNFLRSDKN